MNTSFQTETELSSVNSILGAIGQAPVTRIYEKEQYNNKDDELLYINPEVAFVHQLLMEVNTDVQNEGWVWNREDHYPLTPDFEGDIHVPENILRMDVSFGQVWRTSDLVKLQMVSCMISCITLLSSNPRDLLTLTSLGSGTMKNSPLFLNVILLYVLVVALLHSLSPTLSWYSF